LGTQDGTRSNNPDPADEWLSWDLVVLHGPQANEGARSAETSLAVDRDGAAVWLSEMIITNSHELFHDVVRRSGSINEE